MNTSDADAAGHYAVTSCPDSGCTRHDRVESLVLLVARISIGAVFWQSGRTKVDGFALNDTARYLFAEEYRLPFVDPTFAAGTAAIAEHALPLLLVLGLGTRYAAAGLLAMTAVIQVFVYPDAWPTHGTWAALLALLIARGGGGGSVDALYARWRRRD